jgi:hypothetical protein
MRSEEAPPPASRHSDRVFCLTAKNDEAPIAIGAREVNVRYLIGDPLNDSCHFKLSLSFVLTQKKQKVCASAKALRLRKASAEHGQRHAEGLQNAPANILAIAKFGRVISDYHFVLLEYFFQRSFPVSLSYCFESSCLVLMPEETLVNFNIHHSTLNTRHFSLVTF